MGIEDEIKGRYSLPSEQNLALEILLDLESEKGILNEPLSDMQAHRCSQLLKRAGYSMQKGEHEIFKADVYEALMLANKGYKAQKGNCSFDAFPLSIITKGLFLLQNYEHLRNLYLTYKADL